MAENDSSSVGTDFDLVQRVRAGDLQAFGTLVERYEHGLLGVVLPVIGNPHAAQDVVQDVFVQCYLKLATLRDASRLAFWLHKIARREAFRTLRQGKRSREALSRIADIERADEPAMLDDEKQRLLNSVQQLPAHERLIVSLRFFDGHSVREISEITKRPIGTVTKQLSRALERLRNKLSMETNHVQFK